MEFFMGHFGKALLTGASILAVGILVVAFLKSDTAWRTGKVRVFFHFPC